MKTRLNIFKMSLVAFGYFSILLAGGCSKKSSNDDSPAAPVLQTKIDGAQLVGNNVAQISYSASIETAEFQCKSDIDGQVGTWASCPTGSQMVKISGNSHVFFVKAVLENGVEDATPASRDLASLLLTGNTNQNSSLVTVIKDKASISPVYSKTKLVVQFSLQNPEKFNSSDVRFECKSGSEVDFRPCQDSAGNTNAYEFATLNDGTSYTLSVRAALISTQQKGIEEVLTFKVDLSAGPQLNVNGIEALQNGQVGRSYNLSIDGSQAQSYTCTLDGTAINCASGQFRVTPTAGSHSLSIIGLDANGEEIGSRLVNYCMGNGCGDSGYATITNQPIALGTFFEFYMPLGMHLESYSSTKTFDGALEYYNMANPNAMNYGCFGQRYEVIPLRSPGFDGRGGETYSYCHGTTTRDFFKGMSDYRFANNHIGALSDSDSEDRAYMQVQAFDADHEFMNEQSLFRNDCQNRPVEAISQVPLFRDFFWGNALGTVFKCDAYNSASGLGGALERWKVAYVFIAEGGNLPAFNTTNFGTCTSTVTPCSFKYKKAIEIVYKEIASQNNAFDDDFFRRAQAAIETALFKHTPN